MGKLEGKVALVTGSGRNIGRATVLQLAGEGAHVVVNARANQQEAESVAREARDLGVRAVPVLADVGKKAEVESLAARALSEFGRVDILINNAAIRPHKPFTESTDVICGPAAASGRPPNTGAGYRVTGPERSADPVPPPAGAKRRRGAFLRPSRSAPSARRRARQPSTHAGRC